MWKERSGPSQRQTSTIAAVWLLYRCRCRLIGALSVIIVAEETAVIPVHQPTPAHTTSISPMELTPAPTAEAAAVIVAVVSHSPATDHRTGQQTSRPSVVSVAIVVAAVRSVAAAGTMVTVAEVLTHAVVVQVVTASHITSITETVRLDRHVAPVLWPNLEDSTTVLQHQHHVSHSFSSTSLSLAAFVYCSQFIPGKPERIPSHSFFYQAGEKLRNFFIRLQIFSTSWWKRMAIYMPGLNWLQLKNAAIAYFWWCSRVEYRTKIYLMSVQIYFRGANDGGEGSGDGASFPVWSHRIFFCNFTCKSVRFDVCCLLLWG